MRLSKTGLLFQASINDGFRLLPYVMMAQIAINFLVGISLIFTNILFIFAFVPSLIMGLIAIVILMAYFNRKDKFWTILLPTSAIMMFLSTGTIFFMVLFDLIGKIFFHMILQIFELVLEGVLLCLWVHTYFVLQRYRFLMFPNAPPEIQLPPVRPPIRPMSQEE